MRKYVAGFILGMGLVLGVVSCVAPAGAEEQAPSGPTYQDTWHKMPDGRVVYCLYIEGRIGGYSNGATPSFECDFANVSVQP